MRKPREQSRIFKKLCQRAWMKSRAKSDRRRQNWIRIAAGKLRNWNIRTDRDFEPELARFSLVAFLVFVVSSRHILIYYQIVRTLLRCRPGHQSGVRPHPPTFDFINELGQKLNFCLRGCSPFSLLSLLIDGGGAGIAEFPWLEGAEAHEGIDVFGGSRKHDVLFQIYALWS